MSHRSTRSYDETDQGGCMTTRITEDELLLASRISAAGIPLNQEDLENMQVASYRTDRRRLTISQYGGEVENCAFVIAGHGTGYIVTTRIVNDRGGMIALCDVALELPWADRYFTWLGQSSEIYRGECYRFPGKPYLDYPKKETINHFVLGQRRLRHDNFVDGALLGSGARKIPDCFPHGFPVEGKLAVTDQLGIRHTGEISLYIDRSAALIHKKCEAQGGRRPLFDEVEVLAE